MTGDECATRRSSASHGARLGRGGPSTATHQEGLVCACSCCCLFVCLLVYVVVAGCAGSGVGDAPVFEGKSDVRLQGFLDLQMGLHTCCCICV